MIKAVFIDIDGTLLSHKTRRIPDSTRRTIAALREKGIKCVIATGRHMMELGFLPMGDLRVDGYMMLNGQMGYDGDGKALYEVPFDEEARRFVIGEFRKKAIPFELVERDRMYINYIDETTVEVLKTVTTGPPVVGEYTGAPIFMATAFAGEREVELRREYAEHVLPARWHPYGIDLLPKTSGKDFGIRQYMAIFGLDREETMAFGDEENDVEMLRYAGIGVAMGNGADITKAAADHVTADIDDDGLEKAVKYFGLL